MRVMQILVLLWMLFVSSSIICAMDLELHIQGVLKKPGKIQVAIFDNKVAFDAKDSAKAAYTTQQLVREGTTKVLIKNVKQGKYAVAVLHDENENGKLETGVFGIPKEGVAASNWDGKGKVIFSEALTVIDESTSPLILKMKYF